MEKTILTKEELKIIELFHSDLFSEYTIREMAKKLGKKSYGWVFQAAKKLNNEGILKLNVKGKSNLCSVNLESLLVLDYFSILEKKKFTKSLPLKNITTLIDSVPVSYFTFIISGSYAEGKANKNSDLDVVVIVENQEDSKKVFSILRNKGELMIPPVHIFVFTKKEFLEMLLEKEENYGKLTFKKNIILFGAQNYYIIIKEAIKNGFKG